MVFLFRAYEEILFSGSYEALTECFKEWQNFSKKNQMKQYIYVC